MFVYALLIIVFLCIFACGICSKKPNQPIPIVYHKGYNEAFIPEIGPIPIYSESMPEGSMHFNEGCQYIVRSKMNSGLYCMPSGEMAPTYMHMVSMRDRSKKKNTCGKKKKITHRPLDHTHNKSIIH
jgi:hypothetical protein